MDKLKPQQGTGQHRPHAVSRTGHTSLHESSSVAYVRMNNEKWRSQSAATGSTSLTSPFWHTFAAISRPDKVVDTNPQIVTTTASHLVPGLTTGDLLTEITSIVPSTQSFSSRTSPSDNLLNVPTDATTSSKSNPTNQVLSAGESFGQSTVETSSISGSVASVSSQASTVIGTDKVTNLAPPVSQASNSTEQESSECGSKVDCTFMETSKPNHQAVIAGSVFGLVGIGVLVFAAAVCYKWRRRQGKDKLLSNNDVCMDKSSESATSLQFVQMADTTRAGCTPTQYRKASVSSEDTNNAIFESSFALTTGRVSQPLFGSSNECAPRTANDDSGLHSNASSIPPNRTTNHSGLEAVNSTTHQNNCDDALNQSQCSSVFPGHSTADLETISAALISRTSSFKQRRDLGYTTLPTHKHASVNSAKSTDFSDNNETEDTPEDETFSIEKARTANIASVRRHSLMPRIVNIVAATQRNTDEENDGTQSQYPHDNSFECADRHRSSASTRRARSASPVRATARYSGSPTKLNEHFGIDTWNV